MEESTRRQKDQLLVEGVATNEKMPLKRRLFYTFTGCVFLVSILAVIAGKMTTWLISSDSHSNIDGKANSSLFNQTNIPVTVTVQLVQNSPSTGRYSNFTITEELLYDSKGQGVENLSFLEGGLLFLSKLNQMDAIFTFLVQGKK